METRHKNSQSYLIRLGSYPISKPVREAAFCNQWISFRDRHKSQKNIWSQRKDLRSRVLHPKKNFERRFLKHISKTGHSYLANFNTCGNLLSLSLKNSTTNVWPYLLHSTVIAISCNDDARHKKWKVCDSKWWIFFLSEDTISKKVVVEWRTTLSKFLL